MTNPDVLDPAVVDSLRQLTPPGEPDVLGEVLRLFLDEVPRRVARLKAAWDDRNAGELQRAAHSLKGSSGNIGAHWRDKGFWIALNDHAAILPEKALNLRLDPGIFLGQ